ncbi:MAG: tRNA pseudouridine(38-40) synthase TruA [Acidobacteria bacterium]|nr:MAG: tRNA pseudouridine(38-40) synthase TruA [Acidobacteriota bacterium]
MARFKIFLEYQGTRYRGWQIQQNARTVQGEISKALQAVFPGKEFEFSGAGRTDAGVHALLQVAHLDLDTRLAPAEVRRRVNDELPPDINILRVEEAPSRFHARHHAVSRIYLYQVCRRRTAFGKNYVWWVPEDLDLQRMREAADIFLGMRDFKSFTADEPEAKSTRVLVDRLEIEESGDLILIRIQGSHFLWKMVRRIVGVLVEVGRDRLSIEDVRRFMQFRSGRPAELTAPSSGLFLESVLYEGESGEEDTQEGMVPLIRIRSHAPAAKSERD